MTGSPLVSRTEALKKRTHHQFIPGMGYIAHSGPPDLPPGASGMKSCTPPAGTKDGSVHVLQPPGGHPVMQMIWIEAEHAWAPTKFGKGNRLAWPTSHLSRAGWEYLKPDGAKKAR